MCGILGCFGATSAHSFIKQGLQLLQNRGRDAVGVSDGKHTKYAQTVNTLSIPTEHSLIAHTLHAVVSHVPQPLVYNSSYFVANCEIYNWEELKASESIHAENDAQLLHKLINTQGIESLSKVNGVYAFCYWKDETVILARDIVGEKPIHYCQKDEAFYFASERKVLLSLQVPVMELHPRTVLTYNTQKKTIELSKRSFFTVPQLTTDSQDAIATKVWELLTQSILKRVPQTTIGVLFSGGIDSTLLCYILKNHSKPFHAYVAGTPESEDVIWAKKIAQQYDFPLTVVERELSENDIIRVAQLIESTNVIKVGVALPFYYCCQQAQADGIRVMFSGLGSEEIFAGYERHSNSHDINKECLSGLRKMYERDLYRDDVITMEHSIELRLPFLDTDLIQYALGIPDSLKITPETKKFILRASALANGLDTASALRPKKAAQYGSRYDKEIEKLAKARGFHSKAKYVQQLVPQLNQKLAVLFSTGKDSNHALSIMKQQHYSVDVLLTIQSENKDSYMFHTPAIHMAQLQAESLGIPLLTQSTPGEKEVELDALYELIKTAKETYFIQGVVTGALYSTYQRERVEAICEQLGLQVFSPLWHANQTELLRHMIRQGYEFIFTKVAAEGLDASWVNRIITMNDVDRLEKLHHSIGLHVAGEGGEFESLVLYGPEFSRRIIIDESRIHTEGLVSELEIQKAHLE